MGDPHPQEVLAVCRGRCSPGSLTKVSLPFSFSLTVETLHFLNEEMQMCHWSHTADHREPKDHRACKGYCVEMLMTGALKFWLRKKGSRKLVLFYRGSRGSLVRNTLFSLTESLSQAHCLVTQNTYL